MTRLAHRTFAVPTARAWDSKGSPVALCSAKIVPTPPLRKVRTKRGKLLASNREAYASR